MPRGIVIKQENDVLTIENPGTIRVGKYQMKVGGESDPRNKALMKMFNLIGIGERAGSGVPELFSVWEDEGWEEPLIKESFNPDRTVLKLAFKKKVPKKSAEKKCQKKMPEKSAEKKVPKKTQEQYAAILAYMHTGEWYKTTDFLDVLDVKERRIKNILHDLVDSGKIINEGTTKGKRYKKV